MIVEEIIIIKLIAAKQLLSLTTTLSTATSITETTLMMEIVKPIGEDPLAVVCKPSKEIDLETRAKRETVPRKLILRYSMMKDPSSSTMNFRT